MQSVQFGPYKMDAWYFAPYPEDYTKLVETLLVCEFCLKYMKTMRAMTKHMALTPHPAPSLGPHPLPHPWVLSPHFIPRSPPCTLCTAAPSPGSVPVLPPPGGRDLP